MRLPAKLARALKADAAREGLSLNTLIIQRLTREDAALLVLEVVDRHLLKREQLLTAALLKRRLHPTSCLKEEPHPC